MLRIHTSLSSLLRESDTTTPTMRASLALCALYAVVSVAARAKTSASRIAVRSLMSAPVRFILHFSCTHAASHRQRLIGRLCRGTAADCDLLIAAHHSCTASDITRCLDLIRFTVF